MKKITIISFCLCIIMTKANAQLDTTSSMQEKYKVDSKSLLKKAKHQQTTAFILLGAGTGLLFAGESIIAGEKANETANELGAALTNIFTLGYANYEPAPVKHSTIAPVMVYAGLAAMLTSIPIFGISHHTKKEAKLIIKNETLPLVPDGSNKQVAAGLKINF
jgi:hypothetical protein